MHGVLFVLALATLSPVAGNDAEQSLWPFAPSDTPHFVANHFCAPLRIGETRGYIHGGIDIPKPAGTAVLAISDGWLHVYREGAMDNAVLVEETGDRWEYRHLAAGSTPTPVRAGIAAGTPIEAGTVIGTVAPWGLDYAHLHLNRRRADGSIVDPLAELLPAEDTAPPVIEEVAFLPADGDVPLPAEPDGALVIAGEVRLVVVAHDPSGRERFVHPPRRIEAAIVSASDGATAIALADWHPFDGALPGQVGFPIPRYPRGRALAPYLRTGPLATENPIPRPGRQRFSIIATDTEQGSTWDSRAVADGPATVTVIVSDRAGNRTTRAVSVVVRNGSPPTLETAPAHDLVDRLARIEHATAFAGDRVRATFAVPAHWLTDELFHLPQVTIVACTPTRTGASLTIEADTTGLEGIHTFEVRAGTRVDDARRLIVEIAPLFTLLPSTPRLTARGQDGFALRIALRTTGGLVTFHHARWSGDGESGEPRITRHGLRTLGPTISTVTLQVPEAALGGILELTIEIAGRRRSVTFEIPRTPTGTAL